MFYYSSIIFYSSGILSVLIALSFILVPSSSLFLYFRRARITSSLLTSRINYIRLVILLTILKSSRFPRRDFTKGPTKSRLTSSSFLRFCFNSSLLIRFFIFASLYVKYTLRLSSGILISSWSNVTL